MIMKSPFFVCVVVVAAATAAAAAATTTPAAEQWRSTAACLSICREDRRQIDSYISEMGLRKIKQ